MPTRRDMLKLVLMMLAGHAVNYLTVPIFFGAGFIFGSIFTMLIVRCYGVVFGVLAALVISWPTVVLWEHPFGLMTFVAEAAFVGMGLAIARWTERDFFVNAVFLNALFWCVLGAPMLLFFIEYQEGIPNATAHLLVLKNILNGLFNVVAASCLLLAFPALFLRDNCTVGMARPLSLKFAIDTCLATFVVLPLLVAILIFERAAFEHRLSDADAFAALQNRSIAEAVERPVAQVRAGLAAVSEQLATPDPDATMRAMQRIEPAITCVFARAPGGAWDAASDCGLSIGAQASVLGAAHDAAFAEPLLQVADPDSPGLVHVVLADSAEPGDASLLAVVPDWPSIIKQSLDARSAPHSGAMSYEVVLQDGQTFGPVLDASRPADTRRAATDVDVYTAGEGTVLQQWTQGFIVTETPLDGPTVAGVVLRTPLGPIIQDFTAYVMEHLTLQVSLMLIAILLIPFISSTVVSVLRRFTADIARMDEIDFVRPAAFPTSRFLEIRAIVDQARVFIERIELERSRNLIAASELSTMIETANAPIIGFDVDGRVTVWNSKIAELTGVEGAEIIGSQFYDFFARSANLAIEEVLHVATSKDGFGTFELRLVPLTQRNAVPIDLQLNVTRRHDVSGAVVGVIGVGQDLTQVRAWKDQVQQAEKLATLGEMITGLAHEMNQPMNVIRIAAANTARRIETGRADDAFVLDKLGRIEKQIDRASAMIDHLKVFGRVPKEPDQVFDPGLPFAEAADLISPHLKRNEIVLTTSMPDVVPAVFGHPILLEQVILNVLSNASDAILDSGHTVREIDMTMSVNSALDALTICVSDTGRGIPVGVSDKIFEPFFTTKPMGKGTGLGLSVSSEIVTEMGGTMTARNGTRGAIFTISLPAKPDVLTYRDEEAADRYAALEA